MSTIKIRFALQGPVKYRDGRKWKRRYCVLALAPKTEDGMHLYLAKSYDEFAPYRSRGCVVDVQIPTRDDAELSSKLGCTPSSYRYLGQSGDAASLLPTRPASAEYDGSGPLVNTATQSCATAVESTSLGLSAASNLASTLNAPAPVDEIIGFESGYHMDKESNVIVLVGNASVYVIAVQSTDEMFRWADTMAKIMTDVRFRVTLRRSVEGSKLPQGIQGSLHIQHWRLCLIGEPSAGCKFICSWRLDCIEKAHTMTSVISGANSGTSEQQPGARQLEEDKHRISLGSLSVLNSPVATNLGMSTSASNTRQVVDRPRHLLILSASHSAGKGRGLHTFELDGGSLPELTSAIERFMALRYNPRLMTGVCPTCYTLTSSEVGRPTSTLSKSHSSSHQSESRQSKDLGNNSSLSSDASENLHSVSPAQRFPSKRQAGDLMTYRSSPLTMPAAVGPMMASGLNIHHQRNLYGQSVPLLSSSQFTRTVPQYSNVLCSSSSLSPPVSSKHPDNPAIGTRTAANQPDGDDHSMSIDFLSRCDDSVLSHSAGSRNSSTSLEESVVRPLSQSVSVCSCSACPDQSSLQAAVTRAAWTCPSSSGLSNPISSLNYMRQNPVEPSRNSDPTRVSSNRREFTEASNLLNTETQVAKVAAGLIIARRPSGSTAHSTNMYTRQPPPLPPALESDRGSLNPRLENSSTTNSFLHPIMSVHATDVHSVLSTSFHDGSVCDHVNEEQQIRRRRSYPHQQSLLAQHSDILSGDGGSAQHGIFSIDEDLWEPDGRCCDRCDDAGERLHHTMPTNMSTRIFPLPGTLEVLPKSEVSTGSNDGKLTSSILGTARAPVESDQAPVFNLLTKYYREQLYRLYRHRLRQYRTCFCIHCLVRSLSSDALLLLRYDDRLSVRAKMSQGQSPEFARTALSTSTASSAASPTHSISSRPVSGSAYANSSSNVPTGSQTNAGITKITCGSRLKHINRFFHRKHSKSHDSLRSPSRSVHLAEAENATGGSVGPQIPSSVAEGESATYRPNASELKPYNTGASIAEHDVPPIILRCPRHGIRSYRPCSEFIHRFDLAHYPRYRKETKQPRQSSNRKHSKLRAHHSLTCGLPSSVVSNLLELVRLRNSTQGMKSDANESVGKGITLPATGYPSSAGEVRFLIDLFRSTNGQLPTQSSASESKDHQVSSNIRSSSAQRTQSPKSRNSRISFDIGFPDIRPHHSLSLTSLSCSEPAFGSRMALPLGYSDLPSHYSSLSSLLTFHSLSGSSSIMSGSHALGDISARKTVVLPSVDSAVKISHNSGDGIDGGQARVSYYPEESSFESVLVLPGENLRSNPPTTARCGSPLQKVSETDSPLHAMCCSGRRGPYWSNYGHVVGRGSPPRVPTDSKKNATKLYDLRNGETVGEGKHVCAKILRKTPTDYKLRSSTLPNTSAFRSKFERKSLDEISPIRDDSLLLNQSIAGVKETDDERRIHWLESDGESGRSYSVMFQRGVRPSSQSNIETNVSPVPSNSSISRKQSIQSDAGTSFHQNEDVGSASEGHGHCPPNYCNFVPVSNVSHLPRTGPQFQDACTKINHNFVPHVDTGGLVGNESSRANYVNVPLPATHQMSEYANCNPPTVNRLNRQPGFVFGSTDVRPLSKSSNNRLLLPKSGARTTMRTTSGSQQFPSNLAGTIPITANGHLGLTPADNKPVYPSNASQLSSVPSLYPAMPAEVRDPSRNYAMVDLRPSPASSATVTAELALNATYHPVHSSLMDELTSVGSSSASILGFSTNTSTGSDCTSDAATLTSETVGSYAAVCPHSEAQSDANSGSTCPPTRPVFMDSTRRRHSHSLSSAVCDPPVLNYVRVIASTTPLTVPDPTLHEDDSIVSDPIACSIPIHSDSPSSSSGLGGVASQSITPPLAPTCASFSEIFNCRSMTSSATSSAEGNGVDAGFQSYSPSDQGCVAYTQIDFARTLALGELCGDIEQDKQVAPSTTSSTQPRACSTKTDRPASMRKTLTRSIRSIRQKSGKKGGNFFS